MFWTIEHMLWAVYFITFVLGDTVTTVYGLSVDGIVEKNALMAPILQQLPFVGDILFILATKAVATLSLYYLTLQLRPTMQSVAVGLLALFGSVLLAYNIRVIMLAEGFAVR